VSNQPYRAPIALRVDLVDTQRIAGANADARFSIFRAKRPKQLNNLSIQLKGDQPVSFCIEAGCRSRLIPDTAFQREGRR
jgi:hypothetical protein